MLKRVLGPVLALTLACAACSPIDDQAIRKDFERSHPGCHVSALEVGEGDSDNAYIRFRFRCGTESADRDETWLYQRKGGEWKATAKVPNRAMN